MEHYSSFTDRGTRSRWAQSGMTSPNDAYDPGGQHHRAISTSSMTIVIAKLMREMTIPRLGPYSCTQETRL